MREAYLRPGNPAPGQERQREGGFWRYDGLVREVLSSMMTTAFPPTYQIKPSVGKGWYLVPPDYSARVSPLEVRLCFDERGRPQSFELHTSCPDDEPVTCALEEKALRVALASLFPRYAAI